jgi:capsular exopolysaccharide synthesis family protein
MRTFAGGVMQHSQAVQSRRPDDERYAHEAVPRTVDLNEIIRLLWRQKIIIVGTVFASTLLAVVVLFLLTPTYTATATVVLDPSIDPRQRHAVDVQPLAGLPADAVTVQTEIQVLSSRELAGKVVDQLALDRVPEFNSSLRPPPFYASWNPLNLIPSSWASFLHPAPADVGLAPDDAQELQRARVVDVFLSDVKVAAAGDSRALSVAVSSEDPRLAAVAANALADLYITAQFEAKVATTQKSNKWLTDQLSKLREQVEVSQRKVESYRNEAGLLMGKDITVAAQEVIGLQQQLTAAQAQRSEAEARLRQAKSVSPKNLGTIPEVLDSKVIETLRQQQATLTAQAARMSKQIARHHPDMISMQSQIADVNSKIEDEVARIIGGLENQVSVAQASENELKKRLVEMKGDVGRANEAQGRLRALQGEATANQQLYDSFLEKLKQTGGDDLFQESDAHLVSHADVPANPSFPRKKILLLLVVAASGFLGIVLAFINELLDEGVRSMDQVEGELNVRPLGLIPAQRRSRVKPEDDVVLHRNSAFAEALRNLYTGIALSGLSPIKTILITSTMPKEGKTTTAVSLARLLAASGKKVIVVDCDLRRPQLHAAFGSGVEPGLTNHLLGETTLAEVVRHDAKSAVDFITAGGGSCDPSAIFESSQMKWLLDSLGTTYDLVILDSAPVLAVSDARILCRLAQKTVYLLRWADTRGKAATNGLRQIVDAGGDLAGVALTRVDVKRHAQYGFADSGYYSGPMIAYYSR